MLNILNIYGKVKIHRAVSRFQSENIDEIINLALKSIGPKKSKKEACIKFLKKLLKTKYFLRKSVDAPLQRRTYPVEIGTECFDRKHYENYP